MNFECRYKLPASEPELQWWFHFSVCNPECRIVINNKSRQTNFAQPLLSWLWGTESNHKPNITFLERKGIIHRKNLIKSLLPSSPHTKNNIPQKAAFPIARLFRTSRLALHGTARCRAATCRAHISAANIPSCAWKLDVPLSLPEESYDTDTWKCLWQPGEIGLFFSCRRRFAIQANKLFFYLVVCVMGHQSRIRAPSWYTLWRHARKRAVGTPESSQSA